jgi:hypothetical protein
MLVLKRFALLLLASATFLAACTGEKKNEETKETSEEKEKIVFNYEDKGIKDSLGTFNVFLDGVETPFPWTVDYRKESVSNPNLYEIRPIGNGKNFCTVQIKRWLDIKLRTSFTFTIQGIDLEKATFPIDLVALAKEPNSPIKVRAYYEYKRDDTTRENLKPTDDFKFVLTKLEKGYLEGIFEGTFMDALVVGGTLVEVKKKILAEKGIFRIPLEKFEVGKGLVPFADGGRPLM